MKVVPKYEAFGNDKKIIEAIKAMTEEQADILFLTGEFKLCHIKLELYKNCVVKLDWHAYDKEEFDGEERYLLMYKGRKTETLIFKAVDSNNYECRINDTYTLNLLTENWIMSPCIFTHWKCHNLYHLQALMEVEYRKWKLFCNLPEKHEL